MTAFSPEYVTYVLNENFEDAKALFLAPLMAIHYAHLVMLAAQEIVSAEDAHALRVALDGVSQDEVRKAPYDGTCEDLFFYVERLIVEACGDDVAGRLHTARSRNDIDMTMYRMRAARVHSRPAGRHARAAPVAARLADRHRDTILAVHTHTQRAQPTTVAHYLLAVVEQLERDASRLMARLRAHEPQSARRVRDHRHRISDRSAADVAICSASADRPATPTAASRRSTTCSRARRQPPCC